MLYSKEILKYNNVIDFDIYIFDYGLSKELILDDSLAQRDAEYTFHYLLSRHCSFYAV